MQRWFLFWALFALPVISTVCFAEDTPPPAPDSSDPGTHPRRGSSLVENLTILVEEQSGKIDAQSKAIEQLGKQVEFLSRQLDAGTSAGTASKKRIHLPESGNSAIPAAAIAATPTPAPAPVPAAALVPAADLEAFTEPGKPVKLAPAAKPAHPAAAAPTAEAPAAATAVSGSDSALTHVVKKGENLTTIARRANTTVPDILKLNKIEDERKLQIGQVLILPKPGTSGSSQPNKDTH